jgi:hypothetical protein
MQMIQDAVYHSIDLWTAYCSTLQDGLEPVGMLAAARSCTPILHTLGKVVKPLASQIEQDCNVIEADMRSSATIALSLGGLVGERDVEAPVVQSIVWLHRGLTFAKTLAFTMSTQPTSTTTECTRKAYDAVLAPHHSTPVRAIFRRAFKVLPNRVKMRARIAGVQTDALLMQWAQVVEPVLLHIDMLCAERDWTSRVSCVAVDEPDSAWLEACM